MIIYGPGNYHDICMKLSLPTLASRRTEICTSFFNNSVLNKNSCLYYLLPRPRGEEIDKLRRPLAAICSTDCQNHSISAILPDLCHSSTAYSFCCKMYNDVIFVFIVFYVDPGSGLPYSINLCVYKQESFSIILTKAGIFEIVAF